MRRGGQSGRSAGSPGFGYNWAVLYVALWYLAMSLLTVVAFARDKRAAGLGLRRTPERTLHVLELVGGWPGALVAMRAFRHKRRKPAYWLVTAAIVLLHAVAWTWLAYHHFRT